MPAIQQPNPAMERASYRWPLIAQALGSLHPFLWVTRPMKNRFILTPYLLDEPLPELEALRGPDWRLNTLPLPHTKRQPSLSVLYESLARMVAESLESGHCPVSIAGDCCSSIGVAAGMQRAGADCFLVWFDAHGDFNTWETTPSGFLVGGGFPLPRPHVRCERHLGVNLGSEAG